MGLRISQNIAAINAYRNLSVTDGQMAKSMRDLAGQASSSGSQDTNARTAAQTELIHLLGAVQYFLEHTISNLSVAMENLSASESRIPDTDMAQEMASFVRSQILTQAGTAMAGGAQVVPLVAANRSDTLAPVVAPPATPAAPATVPDQIVSAVVPLHGRGDGRHEITLELRRDDLSPLGG